MPEKQPGLRYQNNRSMPPASVIPVLAYRDVIKSAAWLCRAFGFVERLRIGTHRVQLAVGAGAVVVTELPEDLRDDALSLRAISIMIRIESADSHFKQARELGAKILAAPTGFPYGERQYTAEDPCGNRWTFSESIADVDPLSWGGAWGEIFRLKESG